MKTYAADDYTLINSRIKEIKTQEEPKCPRNNGVTLFNCLRSSTRCGAECPNFHDWIGPEND